MKVILMLVSLLQLITFQTLAVTNFVPPFNDWIKASKNVGIEASLLYSMALAESGKTIAGHFTPHPFAIALGVDERVGQLSHEGFYPETFEQAKVMLENLLSAGYKNIGVGIMQINLKANSHLVDDPVELLNPVYNISIAKKIIKQCSNNRSNTEMLSCYSRGLYNSPEGREYAEKVYQYQSEYGVTFVKSHQPVGVLTLAELTHFYKLNSPNVAAQQKRSDIQTITGTTTYEF